MRERGPGVEPMVGAILDFWFGAGNLRGRRRAEWFSKDPGFDAEIRSRFLSTFESASSRALDHWERDREASLARVVLLDQFPRNMFRDSPRAFEADSKALATARRAIDRGDDTAMLPVERMFLYLPFEHSESLDDQRRACDLMKGLEGFPETADGYRYALRHREIIERFGRFPHRNAALGRKSTPGEAEFLTTPGSGF